MTLALLGVSLAGLLARADADRPLRRSSATGSRRARLTSRSRQSVRARACRALRRCPPISLGPASGRPPGPDHPLDRCSRRWRQDFVRTARAKGLSGSAVVGQARLRQRHHPGRHGASGSRVSLLLSGSVVDRDRATRIPGLGPAPRHGRPAPATTRSSRAGCSWSPRRGSSCLNLAGPTCSTRGSTPASAIEGEG